MAVASRSATRVQSQRTACLTPVRHTRSRAVVVVRASGSAQDLSSRGGGLRVLSAVADLCEVEGLTSKFESFAGRSAMLGVSVAFGVEALTEHSLLAPVPDAEAQAYVALSVLAIVSASAVAALQAATRSSRHEAPVLLEPVITSLTAVKRSAAAVSMEGEGKGSKDSLDLAVDNVFNTIFTRTRLDWLTDATFYVDI